MKAEEELELIDTWNRLAKRNEKFGYKPTEATEKQLDYISELSKSLDRRDASTLIFLLNILNGKEEEKE